MSPTSPPLHSKPDDRSTHLVPVAISNVSPQPPISAPPLLPGTVADESEHEGMNTQGLGSLCQRLSEAPLFDSCDTASVGPGSNGSQDLVINKKTANLGAEVSNATGSSNGSMGLNPISLKIPVLPASSASSVSHSGTPVLSTPPVSNRLLPAPAAPSPVPNTSNTLGPGVPAFPMTPSASARSLAVPENQLEMQRTVSRGSSRRSFLDGNDKDDVFSKLAARFGGDKAEELFGVLALGDEMQDAGGANDAGTTNTRRSTVRRSTIQLVEYKVMEVKLQIWMLLEEPFETWQSSAVGAVFIVIIFLSIGHSIHRWQAGKLLPNMYDGDATSLEALEYVELGFNILFTLEVFLRLWSFPQRSHFLRSKRNWADLLAIVPFIVNELLAPLTQGHLSMLSTFEAGLRVVKLCRYFSGWEVLFHALRGTIHALIIPLYFLAVIVMFGSSVLLSIENTQPGGSIATLPDAVYYALVCVISIDVDEATDLQPETAPGHAVAAALMTLGVMFMAMPITIVGSYFSESWRSKERIFLLSKVRQRITSLGLSVNDINEVFEEVDSDSSGAIEFDEFKKMVETFHLNLSLSGVYNLFRYFDADGDNQISFEDFVCTLYPDHDVDALIEGQGRMRASQEHRESSIFSSVRSMDSSRFERGSIDSSDADEQSGMDHAKSTIGALMNDTLPAITVQPAITVTPCTQKRKSLEAGKAEAENAEQKRKSLGRLSFRRSINSGKDSAELPVAKTNSGRQTCPSDVGKMLVPKKESGISIIKVTGSPENSDFAASSSDNSPASQTPSSQQQQQQLPGRITAPSLLAPEAAGKGGAHETEQEPSPKNRVRGSFNSLAAPTNQAAPTRSSFSSLAAPARSSFVSIAASTRSSFQAAGASIQALLGGGGSSSKDDSKNENRRPSLGATLTGRRSSKGAVLGRRSSKGDALTGRRSSKGEALTGRRPSQGNELLRRPSQGANPRASFLSKRSKTQGDLIIDNLMANSIDSDGEDDDNHGTISWQLQTADKRDLDQGQDGGLRSQIQALLGGHIENGGEEKEEEKGKKKEKSKSNAKSLPASRRETHVGELQTANVQEALKSLVPFDGSESEASHQGSPSNRRSPNAAAYDRSTVASRSSTQHTSSLFPGASAKSKEHKGKSAKEHQGKLFPKSLPSSRRESHVGPGMQLAHQFSEVKKALGALLGGDQKASRADAKSLNAKSLPTSRRASHAVKDVLQSSVESSDVNDLLWAAMASSMTVNRNGGLELDPGKLPLDELERIAVRQEQNALKLQRFCELMVGESACVDLNLSNGLVPPEHLEHSRLSPEPSSHAGSRRGSYVDAGSRRGSHILNIDAGGASRRGSHLVDAGSRRGSHIDAGSRRGSYLDAGGYLDAGSCRDSHIDAGSRRGSHILPVDAGGASRRGSHLVDAGSRRGSHIDAGSRRGSYMDAGSRRGSHIDAGSRRGSHIDAGGASRRGSDNDGHRCILHLDRVHRTCGSKQPSRNVSRRGSAESNGGDSKNLLTWKLPFMN